jgi:hypothetical protein
MTSKSLKPSVWLFANISVGVVVIAYVVLILLGQSPVPGVICLIGTFGTLTAAAGFAADPSRAGVLQTAALMGIAIALMYPFLHPTFVGAGDAADYFRMFADFIEQHRSGIWEIFVGKTAFAFEGTVHTTRTSPMFYHVGVFLDLLSFQSLDHLVLEKITLLAFFCAAGFGFYLCCVRGLGMRPLPALLTAGLYLSAPGILAPIYFSDMYATFTALAFLPLFLTAIILLGDNSDRHGIWILLGVGSGGLLWTHPPMAIWAHLAAFFCLIVNWRKWTTVNPRRLWHLIPIAFILAYPIVSTFRLGSSSVVNPKEIAGLMRQRYQEYPSPWTHLFWVSSRAYGPISFKDWSLSWVLGAPVVTLSLVVLGLCQSVRRIWPLLLSIVILVLLVNGIIPSAARVLWNMIPDVVVRITLFWPLQRFNPIVICSFLLCFAALLPTLEEKLQARISRKIIGIVMGTFLALSLLLAWQMEKVPTEETQSPAATREFVKSDNIVIPTSNYEFMNQGLPFHYITTGRSDPLSEIRLHDIANYSRVIDIFSLRHPLAPENIRALIYNRFNTPICAKIVIPAKTMAVLTFEDLPPNLKGTLELRANGVSWTYTLPYRADGGDMAFGAGDARRHSLLVRNSDPTEKVLEFYFWPQADLQKQRISLGRLTSYTVAASNHYFSLDNLMPLEINLDAPYPVVVETPRIFLNGYAATVDGQNAAVFKSPQGLVAVSVDKGSHRLQVAFEADSLLKWSYRLAEGAWSYLIGYGVFLFYRRQPNMLLG